MRIAHTIYNWLRTFFDLKAFHHNQTISSKPEYQTSIHTKDGQKKPITAQYIYVMDPTSEGFFISGYFIIKTKASKKLNEHDNYHPIDVKSTLNELEFLKHHSNNNP